MVATANTVQARQGQDKDQKLDPNGKPIQKKKTPEQLKKQQEIKVKKEAAIQKQKDALNQNFTESRDSKKAEEIEAQTKRDLAKKNAVDEDGNGIITSDEFASELDLSAAANNQTINNTEDLDELEAQAFAGKGDSGNSGGDGDNAEMAAGYDSQQSTELGNIAELSAAMETQSMVEGMSRKELLELIGLTKEYFQKLLERNPEEMRQAHAAIQSAVAIYLTQLLTELSESEYELEEEEEREGNQIKSSIKNSLEEAARQLNELSNQVNAQNGKRSKKRKTKYLANLYEVPLLKALMKGDAVKRQSVWKAMDKHLESQVEKEEVREEMFRYSF